MEDLTRRTKGRGAMCGSNVLFEFLNSFNASAGVFAQNSKKVTPAVALEK